MRSEIEAQAEGWDRAHRECCPLRHVRRGGCDEHTNPYVLEEEQPPKGSPLPPVTLHMEPGKSYTIEGPKVTITYG